MTARRWRAFCSIVARPNGPYRAVQNHVQRAKERVMTSRLIKGLAAAAALIVAHGGPGRGAELHADGKPQRCGRGDQHRERRQHGRVRRLQNRRGHGSPDCELCRQRLQFAQRRNAEPHPRRRREDMPGRSSSTSSCRRPRRTTSGSAARSPSAPSAASRSGDPLVGRHGTGDPRRQLVLQRALSGEPGRRNPRSVRAPEVRRGAAGLRTRKAGAARVFGLPEVSRAIRSGPRARSEPRR